jgi:restriction system protein
VAITNPLREDGSGADDGIDLVLRKDGKKYYAQCKHWKVYSVGVTHIRELFGVIAANRADGGFFVTSGVYTKEPLAFASSTSIKLLDGPALVKLIADVKSLPTPFALSPSKGSEIAADSAIQSPQDLTISRSPYFTTSHSGSA